MPNLVAYDLAGVQPMSGPTGLIFAMRSKYNRLRTGTETFFDEVDTAFSGQNEGFDLTNGMTTCCSWYGYYRTRRNQPWRSQPFHQHNPAWLQCRSGYAETDDAEDLGTSGDNFNQMAFSIEKVTVTAKSRALKAEYSLELAQDLKAIHGLNAEAELANILSTEILAEINREVIRTIYKTAESGCSN